MFGALRRLLGIDGGQGQAVKATALGGALGAIQPAQKNPMPPQPGQLRVQQGSGMQPNGPSYEDDYTGTTALQPVDYNNRQVSQNGGFLQGNGLPQWGSQYQQPDYIRRLLNL